MAQGSRGRKSSYHRKVKKRIRMLLLYLGETIVISCMFFFILCFGSKAGEENNWNDARDREVYFEGSEGQGAENIGEGIFDENAEEDILDESTGDVIRGGVNESVTEKRDEKDSYDYSAPVPESDMVDRSYFDDAVFIGDSRTMGLIYTMKLTNAVSFAEKGMMVDSVLLDPIVKRGNKKITVIEALKEMEFSKVYIMFGINETGWVYSEVFIQKYGEMIDAIREINPEAVIYVQEIMPVTHKVSDNHRYIKNRKIYEYNSLIRDMAEEKEIYLIDTAGAFATEDGSLPDDVAPDGIHLTKEYCEKWLEYLETHTVTGGES